MSATPAKVVRFAVTPEEIVSEVRHLPSAPKVLPRLKRLLRDGNSSMQEIVRLIRLDPGIAARVLQMGNSAYFNQGAQSATVDDAVHRVGYDQIYELVSFAVASQVLVRPLEVYGVEADELWKLSVACALAAEAIAARTGQDRDIAYTLGLLHNVGMVAIDEWALRNARDLRLRSAGFPREASEHERAVFGFTQAEAGAALLREWEFSGVVTEPVRWQYAPRATATHAKLASLLYAAKWLRNVVCFGGSAKPGLSEMLLMQPVGLTPAMFTSIAAEVTGRLNEVSSLLDGADHDFSNTDWRRFSQSTG
jgi:HD-like signal output (HDOD) protein